MRAAAVLFVVAACIHSGPSTFPDAPLQLRDDADRDQAIDQLWVLPAGPKRNTVRAHVADALARRIADALDEDKPFVAETMVFELAALWQRDPTEVGRGLAGQAPLLHRLRATFAKSGAIEPALACLVMLAEVEPSRRAAHQAEIDEILHFADELAATENGREAQRSQPIALLAPAVLALPLQPLVDRYVSLIEERQRVVAALIDKQGASIQLVRAHQDVLYTAFRIAIVLARAGRTHEIGAHLGKLQGLGTNRELADRAQAVAEQPTADAFVELAHALRTNEHASDTTAALAVCLAGLVKFPADRALLEAAADHASSLGRVEQPIELYEAAIRKRGDVDAAVASRLGKLYAERIARLAFGGRPAAATTAWHTLARFTAEAERRSPHMVWAQVTAEGETALGRGLLSQGRIADGEHALVSSIKTAPSIDAYETLATLHYKTDHLATASRYAADGLKLLGDSSGDRYRRAKLERLTADVLRTAGKSHDAAGLYLDSLRTWAGLGDSKELPRTVAAERLLESGRAMWFLGDANRAVDLVLEAIDLDPDAGATCAEAVAFLLEIGRSIDAADALHRGLSSSGISELYKVYMSLWILADAHRRGEPRDRQGYEYLASRHGDLWYEELAEAATGRLAFPALRSTAATEPRRAELAFYGVVLGLDPAAATPAGTRKLLAFVVDARLVMDAEYDFAREYLSQPR